MTGSTELQVFISYAHADDALYDGAHVGWVSCFVDNLKKVVARYTRRKVKVWIDHGLEEQYTVDAELLRQISGSDLLIVFMSPAYLDSPWCQDEINAFVREVGKGNTDERVFVIEIAETCRDDWQPAPVRGLKPATFWTVTTVNPESLTLGWPLPKPRDDSEYYTRLNTLARRIARRIAGVTVIGADAPAAPAVLTTDTAVPTAVPEPAAIGPDLVSTAADPLVSATEPAATLTEPVVTATEPAPTVSPPVADVPEPPPSLRIVVHFDQADARMGAALVARLPDCGVVAEAAKTAGQALSPEHFPEALQQQMADCDGVLIVCARAPADFVSARIGDARKALGGRRRGDWLRVVLAPVPDGARSELPDCDGVRLIDCRDGFDDRLLQMYVDDLRRDAGRPVTTGAGGWQPYPGLRPFLAREAQIFFGRETHTADLLVILTRERFLAVVGPSGGGKSSLVRAGLQHGLESGALDGASGWRVAVLRPGDRPLHALAQALLQRAVFGAALQAEGEALPEPDAAYDAATARLVAELRRGVDGLRQIRLQAATVVPADRPLLLLVDQFEEIFTYAPAAVRAGEASAPPADVQAFVALLVALPDAPDLHTCVVLTMRTDFYGHCTQHFGLAERINRAQYLVPRLTEAEMRKAIRMPAEKLGGKVDPAFADQLIQTIGGNSDQLPLLQHALMRWWTIACAISPQSPRIDDSCTVEGDDVAHALEHHAEQVYGSLGPHAQPLAELLFRAITEARDGGAAVRRPQRLAAIAGWAGVEVEALRPVVETFAAPDVSFLHHGAQLNARSVIDLTHEALMRQWRRLAGWVEDEARRGGEYRRWAQRAAEHARGECALLSGADLARAIGWWNPESGTAAWEPTLHWARRYGAAGDDDTLAAEFTALRAFLIDSRDADARAREAETRRLEEQAAQERARAEHERSLAERARRMTRTVAVAAVFAIGAAGLAYSQRQEAHRQETVALEAQQKRTVELFESQLTHASLLAAQDDYAEARRVLAESLRLDADIPPTRRHARNLLAGHVLTMGGQAEQVYTGAGAPLIGGVAVSPDGKLLAAAGERGTLVLFEAASGRLLRRLEEHDPDAETNGTVRSLAFAPDGNRLYSAGDDGRILRWSLPDGERLAQWQADGPVQALALSPDGETLAIGGEDGAITLQATRDSSVIRTLTGHQDVIAGRGLRFSPDGQQLASASYDGTARLWSVADGKELHVLRGHAAAVQGVAFSPDGRMLATTGNDGRAMLWATDRGERLRVLAGHRNMVFGVAFSPDGRELLTASFDKTVRQWDVMSGVSRRVDQGHTAGLVSVAVHGQHIYTAANDGTLRRWSLATPQQWVWDTGGSAISAALSPDGRALAVGMEDGALRLYALPDGTLRQQIADAHKDVVSRIAFSPDGHQLATASLDRTAKLWQFAEPDSLTQPPHPLHTLTGHGRSVHAVAWSPDGRRLATAGYDGRIGLFDAQTGNGQLFEAHEGRVASVAFDAGGERLLSTGMDDFRLRLWDLRAPDQPPQDIARAQDALMWADFRPDAGELAAVGREAVVTLLNFAHPDAPQRLVGHENTVYRAIYSPDGFQLATVSMDRTVRVWDTDHHRLLFTQRLPTEFRDPSPLWDFDFRCLPDGDCLIAVPLTMGRVVVYRLPYKNPPPELSAEPGPGA